MNKTAVVTARVSEETLANLDRLAAHHDRSRAWFVAKAVERYVREEGEFDTFIQEGEDAIARGDYVTHEQLVAEIESMLEGKKAA
jgi:predicted transcriptional regulator